MDAPGIVFGREKIVFVESRFGIGEHPETIPHAIRIANFNKRAGGFMAVNPHGGTSPLGTRHPRDYICLTHPPSEVGPNDINEEMGSLHIAVKMLHRDIELEFCMWDKESWYTVYTALDWTIAFSQKHLGDGYIDAIGVWFICIDGRLGLAAPSTPLASLLINADRAYPLVMAIAGEDRPSLSIFKRTAFDHPAPAGTTQHCPPEVYIRQPVNISYPAKAIYIGCVLSEFHIPYEDDDDSHIPGADDYIA